MGMIRLVAPAGAPLPMRAVLSAAVWVPRGGRSFAELLREHLGMRHLFLLSSGRAALTVLLKGLQHCSGRREVVIPAYTCFSVPSAIARAELVIRLCDVDPKTLDLDQNALSRLDLGKALCIIPSGLYGMPPDLIGLERMSRTCGAFLIDDAAQCLGASIKERICGTFGDAGFYSLGRGKNITTLGGGILVTRREDLSDLIGQEVSSLPRPSAGEACAAAISALVYAAMLRPSQYWLLERIPFLGLGVSRFEPNFAMGRLSAYQCRLAAQTFRLLDTYNLIRRRNANRLRAGIDGVEGIEIPWPIHGAYPIYLRFPLLARDAAHRSSLIAQLRKAGIAASASYPTAIGEIPGIERYLAPDQQPCPGARSVATRIITLPTHPYVTSADVEKMVVIIRGNHDRSRKTER